VGGPKEEAVEEIALVASEKVENFYNHRRDFCRDSAEKTREMVGSPYIFVVPTAFCKLLKIKQHMAITSTTSKVNF
jgi:hypothetical protein